MIGSEGVGTRSPDRLGYPWVLRFLYPINPGYSEFLCGEPWSAVLSDNGGSQRSHLPRTKKFQSVDAVLKRALASVVVRTAQVIARSIAGQVAVQLESELEKRVVRGRDTSTTGPRPRIPAAELTRWVADKRARRVPTFVIQMIGLDTKKKIVAKFGENAVFEKGKPLPAPRVAAAANATAGSKQAPRPGKSKRPVIRKAVAVGK